ncbi:MAG: type II toxin-antitoxin system VapC family toxin [Pirellulales bacterium]
MSFLLDTDTCSAHLRRPAGLMHRFTQYSGRLFVSMVGVAELYAWAHHRDDPRPISDAIDFMLQNEVVVLDFDRDCAREFGKLRGVLRRSGTSIPLIDLLIAATARVHDLTLVTHNTADFARVPDLRLEDWVAQ